MRRRFAIVVVALALVALVLAGCQDLQDPGTATSVTASPTSMATQVVTTQQDLVRVPSYQDFKSAYTGDDWGQVLVAWEAAVEEGFSQAGLVADLEVVAPGDTEYQDPEAGTMVPRGTVVHIRVAVYD
jgi:predicted small secreted protein